ncbi:MAG TPA: alpha/beta hydrolase [Microbacterium sp.]|uniref:alpha/beta fold hydrolase n=1 Tax=Microbacterium sp. TaxID=51671 RepID=UPI002C3344D9|nr:alpha/beta hydrolase [Microbacterium sp.]HWI31007.1 alpha/beta hydrolase [Microbacterium sp.]
MDVILVPGLWLDASSWDDVRPALEAAGHATHPLTMPGVGAPADEAAAVGMAEWVAAAVAEIDRLGGPVALVGHSGGGNVAYGAADARPDRVGKVIFIDTFPPGDGGIIWDEFPEVDGVIPFPGWDAFEANEIDDLDAGTRARFEASAQTVPPRVPADPIRLSDERRRDVPATVITCSVPAAQVREFLAKGPAWIAELAAIRDLDLVDVPAGHWPQFSRPTELGEAIVRALAG